MLLGLGMTKPQRDWIAERTLIEGAGVRRVIVRLERPRQISKQEWICSVEIVRGKAKWALDVHGADSVQSLALAMKAARIRLDSLKSTFTWEFAEAGDTGFPIYLPDGFGRDFEQRLEAMIEAEVAQLTSRAGHRKRK